MSGKKGSTTQVSGHVGRMKANMCPLTESKRTHTAQGTTPVSGHVACPLTESKRTHTSQVADHVVNISLMDPLNGTGRTHTSQKKPTAHLPQVSLEVSLEHLSKI